eukprot:CAMPEP_0176171602 /NCGR_PEP_ID=MMETSP0120_2-20121206/87864_1 /TAXON_ID=160619 /ORGANISM="Kryptoperidinium foliaceum, Strain CCMP 1326" /LENGTH=51 /DNA_ID=CAMNT_0017509461 /DNA_START=11 /DNA_END=163 /DNA_ORIENTATION=-
MTKTERECLVHIVAKKNRAARVASEARGAPPSGAPWLEPVFAYIRAQKAAA